MHCAIFSTPRWFSLGERIPVAVIVGGPAVDFFSDVHIRVCLKGRPRSSSAYRQTHTWSKT